MRVVDRLHSVSVDAAAAVPGAHTGATEASAAHSSRNWRKRQPEGERKHRLNNQEKKINCAEWQLVFRKQAV